MNLQKDGRAHIRISKILKNLLKKKKISVQQIVDERLDEIFKDYEVTIKKPRK